LESSVEKTIERKVIVMKSVDRFRWSNRNANPSLTTSFVLSSGNGGEFVDIRRSLSRR